MTWIHCWNYVFQNNWETKVLLHSALFSEQDKFDRIYWIPTKTEHDHLD